MQGGSQNGVAQEEVQSVNEPVGNSEQLSSSEIPNNQSVAEGDAPGKSGVQEITNDERVEMEARIVDWLSEDNLERASGKTRDEIFDEFGNELEPIAYIPTQYISLVSQDLKDQRIYCGKGYFIDHALRNHAKGGKQLNAEDVDVSKYLNIQSVLDNPDSVKETYVDGKRTVVFIKKIGRYFAELTQVEEDGKIVLHKSMFDQKKEPYAKLDDIRSKGTSSEGGVSSISHTAEAAPAISLESRGDVVSNSTESSASEDRNSVSNDQENSVKSDEIPENRGEKAVPSGKLKAKSGKQSLADRVLARAEEKRRIPLRERARELEAQVGVKANIIESLDEVKNREARKRIAAGEAVAGWYSGGQVYLYMPNIKDRREIELTYVHEVVAHHGVKKLLGERFNEFLDGVWNMMSEADRARMLAYVGAKENPTLQDMRTAADEYVAELAEKMNLGELEQSTWEKIVDWFKELLESVGFENLTKEDIESMLKASYSNLKAESGKGKTGSTENDFRARMQENAESKKIFETAKEVFGTTYDMREAGYILPDGTMLDFSGKHQVRGVDNSFLNGGRTVDHREIEDIAYDFDENPTGVSTDMGDFLDRGAIRIDYNVGAINLNTAPTAKQKALLKRLIERNDGDVTIDFGNGWDTEHYAEYESARASRVLGDIDRYYSEGIKPGGNTMFRIAEVNDKFNSELESLNEENADKVVLNVGNPSPVLLSAGVEDRPMKLYGNKIIKKAKKHGFNIQDLKDLPSAVADPIAVFDNYQ